MMTENYFIALVYKLFSYELFIILILLYYNEKV